MSRALIILFICIQTVFGLDTPQSTITFESVLHGALENAVDAKLAAFDRDISAQSVQETKSLYYPTLSIGANGEHVKDLTKGTSTVNVVGDTILSNSSQYQSSVYMSLAYSLYDFGQTSSRVKASRMDFAQKDAAYLLKLRDVKTNVLKLYTDAYIANTQSKLYSRLRLLQQEMLSSLKRLYEAGQASKLQIADEAMNLMDYEARLSSINSDASKALSGLSYYTKASYSASAVDIKGLNETNGFIYSSLPEFSETSEYEAARAKISQKEAELSVANLSILPKLSFYSKYNLYGSSPDKQQGAYGDNMIPRSFTIGIGISMPLFEGFKYNAQTERAKLELEKSRLEMEQTKREYEKNKQKLELDIKSYASQSDSMNSQNQTIVLKTQMIERLKQENIQSAIDTIRQTQEMIKKEIAAVEIKTRYESAKIQAYFMAEKLR